MIVAFIFFCYSQNNHQIIKNTQLNIYKQNINLLDLSGVCGDNIIFNLQSNTLTIEGTGDINNYSQNTSPWYSNRTLINKVIIKDGITSIGKYSLSYLPKLNSIQIPQSVIKIFDEGMAACYGIASSV